MTKVAEIEHWKVVFLKEWSNKHSDMFNEFHPKENFEDLSVGDLVSLWEQIPEDHKEWWNK